MFRFASRLGLFLTLSAVTLTVLWLTRPEHLIWSTIGASPVNQVELILSDYLLSFLIIPLLYSFFVAIRPSRNHRLTITALTLICTLSECSQSAMSSMTFDPGDVLAILLSSGVCFFADSYRKRARIEEPSLKLILFFAIPLQYACQDEPCYEKEPSECDAIIWLTWEQIRADITPEYGDTQQLERPGKLLSAPGELLVVDRYQGFHVFDTSDPLNPMRLAYIPLPGVTDVTTDGAYLYANAFTDVVTLPIDSLRDRSFVPGDERRIKDTLTFPSRQFIANTLLWLNPEDLNRLLDGNYGVPVGFHKYLGQQTLYGEVVETEDGGQEIE